MAERYLGMSKMIKWAKQDNTNTQGLIGVTHLVTYTSDCGRFIIGKVLAPKPGSALYKLYDNGVTLSPAYSDTLATAKAHANEIFNGV